jgi:hypothetical protein
MDEHVLAAVIGRDKAEAFCGIEKLHGSDGHDISFASSGSGSAPCVAGRGNKRSGSIRRFRFVRRAQGGSERQKNFV